MTPTCKREGCTRLAYRDDFCSTNCAKIHNGVLAAPTEAELRERRNTRRRVKALEKKLGTDVVEVENTDAMTRLAGQFSGGPGSPQGFRHG